MNRPDFVCGVDGGGTKTTAICCTTDGKEIARRVFGPFNLNSIGMQAFEGILNELVSFLKETGNCRALCIGAAGITNSRVSDCVENVLGKTGIPYKLLGDFEIAHTGALDGREGIILIAGTGSVCFGKNKNGNSAMAGGWGHLIGDAGSGYGIGRDALSAVARMYDGYGQPTILKDLISQELILDTAEKIVSYVYSNDKSAVAALSPIVEKAYAMGDAVATQIIRSNAASLVQLVSTVASRLCFESCDVALLGGLMEHETALRKEFEKLMSEKDPDLRCVGPLRSAAEGAVMEALSLVKEKPRRANPAG